MVIDKTPLRELGRAEELASCCWNVCGAAAERYALAFAATSVRKSCRGHSSFDLRKVST
jgi:hypothetical protein